MVQNSWHMLLFSFVQAPHTYTRAVLAMVLFPYVGARVGVQLRHEGMKENGAQIQLK